MKKYIAILLLLAISISAMAQEFTVTRTGPIKDGNSYSMEFPTTPLEVELLVEKEVVTPGVYARYALKYLSLRAPLVEQVSYKIVDAQIGVMQQDPSTPFALSEPIVEYSKLPVDLISSTVLNDDDAAKEAAAAIFTIRRQRRDIINGEAGEGYFGAGLEAAMARLDAMEQEYLNLFMGSRIVSQSTKRYVLQPHADTFRYILARFDDKEGVLPSNDLTGSPIYLQLTPQAMPDTSAYGVDDRTRESVWFRISPPTQCTLFNNSEPIATAILTIAEYGKDVQIETVSR